MKTNHQLQIDVIEAIKWEPLLKQTKIDVEANEGVITLSGIVDSFIKKSVAVNTAKKVTGAKALVEKIEIQLNTDDEKSDAEIAIGVLSALKANKDIPVDTVQIEVEDGHVTLDGKLEWNHQKQAAQQSASTVEGIKVLTNRIEIETDNPDDIEKGEIEEAIARNWALNNQDIQVCVSGNKVTLKGIVHSFYQKDVAEKMAWNAPGVCVVNNELIIGDIK